MLTPYYGGGGGYLQLLCMMLTDDGGKGVELCLIWLCPNINVAGNPPKICAIELHYIGASIERLG